MLRRSIVRCCAASASSAKKATEPEVEEEEVENPITPSPEEELGLPFTGFDFGAQYHYWPRFRYFSMRDFAQYYPDRVEMRYRSFKHPVSKITVTLIPLMHEAHPVFYKQIDHICCQHDSVLMEGRVPMPTAPYSTLVPPRKMIGQIRPEGHEDDEGWEPNTEEGFWQPFSWGVIDSPKHTVIHAADAYDYEKLPYWAGARFSLPMFGTFKREKHCFDMIAPLVENGYKSFAVPWGAFHMPVMATALARHGFIPVSEGSLLAWCAVDGLHSASWCRKLMWFQKVCESWWFFMALLIIGVSFLVFILFFNMDINYKMNKEMVLKDNRRWMEEQKKIKEELKAQGVDDGRPEGFVGHMVPWQGKEYKW